MMTVVLAVVYLLVGLTGVDVDAAAEPSCPLPGDIAPCLCSEDDPLGLIMDCSGVTDEPELADVFTAHLPTSNFYELQIFHDPLNLGNRLYSIEESTLGEATFKRVNITGTKILSIAGYAFDKSKSTLQLLALDGNRIKEFPFGSLTRYTSLTTVLLTHNNLDLLPQISSPFLEELDVSSNWPMVIDKDAFTNTPSLQKINLAYTSQESLQRGLFTELGQLQELDLSDNDLMELEESAIVTPNASMTYLDVSKNDISLVRHDSIVGLSSNATLVIAENYIEELWQESWQHVFDQLKPPYGTIDMADNPLVCGCDMAWIVLNEAYLTRFTDTTTCVSGERVIFLDPNIFEILC